MSDADQAVVRRFVEEYQSTGDESVARGSCWPTTSWTAARSARSRPTARA